MKTKILLFLLISIRIFSQNENSTLDSVAIAKSNLVNSEKRSDHLNISLEKIKIQNERLQKKNDSLFKTITTNTLNTQQIIYNTNYEILSNNIKEIDNLQEQMSEYEISHKSAMAGTIITKFITPTSSDLGTSFTDIVINQSKDILVGDLSSSSQTKFASIINNVVSPLVTSVLTSNPVGSIINNVLQQAMSFDNGKIKQQKLNQFIESLQPNIQFYEKFNGEVERYKFKLTTYGNTINYQQKRLNNYKESLYKVLGIPMGNDLFLEVDKLFKKDQDILSLTQLNEINKSRKITELKKIIERMPDFYIDKNFFIESHDEYIDGVINVLNEGKSNTSLKMTGSKLNDIISQLKTNKIGGNP
ncbi:hypothetical protein [Chryseobacterium sp.]|uniref:hypothetical protein n=1 Tax=Chryseobacterium sp. TaxID=1871047 RepID=UPI00321A614F